MVASNQPLSNVPSICHLFSRSEIHGLGLYAKKSISPGDMVIEYSGTVIRSILTDKREKYYDKKV